MKTLIIIAIAITFAATAETWWEHRKSAGIGSFYYKTEVDLESVVWQYDETRERIKRREEQQKFCNQFNATNRNFATMAFPEEPPVSWSPQKGQKELGYRSDGVVVWRDIPEANNHE